MADVERECTLLGTLFQSIVSDLKGSSLAWDDFVSKGTKLHSLLKATTLAVTSFLESIQKIADIATNTRGSTKDIGSALTRICVRQKLVETKLKLFTNSLLDNLVAPISDRLEEWRKVSNLLEKDHAKDYKKAMHEIKKRNSETFRLQKKIRKGSKPDIQLQLNSTIHDVSDRLTSLEETERASLRNLLVEERTRVCMFANCLSPVLDLEVSMLDEVASLGELSSDLSQLCRNPKQLPTSTEQLINDFIKGNSHPHSQDGHSGLTNGSSLNPSPPASPNSNDSRVSSLCSLNSSHSSDSRSSGSLTHTSTFHHHHHRYHQSFHRRSASGNGNAAAVAAAMGEPRGSPSSCSSAPAYPASAAAVARLSSVSSHDSGFASSNAVPPSSLHHNGVATLPPSGAKCLFMPSPAGAPEQSPLDGASTSSPRMRSRKDYSSTSGQSDQGNRTSTGRPFSWKDWSRPGPYELHDAVQQQSPDSNNNAGIRRYSQVLPSKPAHPASSSSTQHAPPISPKPPALLTHRNSEPTLPTSSSPVFRFPPSPLAAAPDREPSPVVPPKPHRLSQTDVTDSVADDEFPLPPPPPELLTGAVSSGDPPPIRQIAETVPSSACDVIRPHAYAVTNVSGVAAPSGGFTSATLGRKNSSHYSNSSGYSSHNTTPACSEDTIASHDTDYGSMDGESACEPHPAATGMMSYDGYSTMPRLRACHHHTQSASSRVTSGCHSTAHRRPVSTSGLPTAQTPTTAIVTSGTATIRRKPSSKFNSIRRTPSGGGGGPKPVAPPTVPHHLASVFLPPSPLTARDNVFDYGSYNTNNNNNDSVVRDLTTDFKDSVEMDSVTSLSSDNGTVTSS